MVERETIYLSGKKKTHIYYKKITIAVKIKQNENNFMSMTLWWTKPLSSLFVCCGISYDHMKPLWSERNCAFVKIPSFITFPSQTLSDKLEAPLKEY